MRTLVIGGGASGKSEYAEELFSSLTGKKFYVATMMPYGKDSLSRIEKHRQARRDRGFSTIEHFYELEKLRLPERGAVLLECLGNLTANELFSLGLSEDEAYKSMLIGIEALALQSDDLVVVTNDVFSGGCDYDESTLLYIRTLGKLNAALAASFDRVIEVVCGIPSALKR
jgi:adenosylcobinamide kinase/adenosylcobinamide-phosphate guanylyltransferase